jgi:hypothetical protein
MRACHLCGDEGENVTERIVRRVFSQSLGLVVHLDRDDIPPNDTDAAASRSSRLTATLSGQHTARCPVPKRDVR